MSIDVSMDFALVRFADTFVLMAGLILPAAIAECQQSTPRASRYTTSENVSLKLDHAIESTLDTQGINGPAHGCKPSTLFALDPPVGAGNEAVNVGIGECGKQLRSLSPAPRDAPGRGSTRG